MTAESALRALAPSESGLARSLPQGGEPKGDVIVANIVTVGVKCDLALGKADLELPQLTLTSSDQYVVWWCVNPPPGGDLVVRFAGSGTGPFAEVRPSGEFWIGSGNVGWQAANDYPYQVVVASPQGDLTGDGVIDNLVQEAVLNVPELVCDPGSGPPKCQV